MEQSRESPKGHGAILLDVCVYTINVYRERALCVGARELQAVWFQLMQRPPHVFVLRSQIFTLSLWMLDRWIVWYARHQGCVLSPFYSRKCTGSKMAYNNLSFVSLYFFLLDLLFFHLVSHTLVYKSGGRGSLNLAYIFQKPVTFSSVGF